MANANAKQLIASIPECVSGCFENGVAATGCDEDDYDCYCYANNHQTIVDTMEVCLKNKERRLDETCTDDDMFRMLNILPEQLDYDSREAIEMENRYWTVCKEYWEPTGTAVEPASATMTPTKTASTSSSRITATTFTTSTSTTSTSSQGPSSVDPESAESTDTISNPKNEDGGLSTGAQAGIGVGVGVGLAVILLGVAIFLWMRERKKRRTLEEKLAEANNASAVRGMGYVNDKGDVFEMEGDRPHAEELRGDMRTPELNGISHVGQVNHAPSSPKSVSTGTTVSSPSSPRSPNPSGLSPPDRLPRVPSSEFDSSGRSLPLRVSSEEDSASLDPLRRGPA
ncbi:hypothetical protein QQX98_011151 [Neonectria punicea]|uniref:CFEM domain-containing protein n=1 Tax=Neonectria punicea TaxID=979145 RepID=A0ABR1GMJ6_9HYPO